MFSSVFWPADNKSRLGLLIILPALLLLGLLALCLDSIPALKPVEAESLRQFLQAAALLTAGVLIVRLRQPGIFHKARRDAGSEAFDTSLSQHTLHLALEQAAILTMTDADGNFLHVNDSFCALCGYTREELVGRNAVMLNAGRHSRAYATELRQALDQGRIWRGERKHRRRNGTGFWLDSTIIPVQDPQGRLQQLVGIHQDITRRKRAEAALRESEARFRAIFHQAAVGIAQVMPHGHLLDMNQQLCRMLGYTRAELLNRSLMSLVHPLDREHLRNLRESLEATSTSTFSLSLRQLCASGTYLWVQLTVSPVHIRGEQPLYCLAVIQDITERIEAEARGRELNSTLVKRVAERTAELLVANEELESFSYSVSHDLRGPLRAINGYCRMILDDADMQLGEEARGQLTRVIAASVRMGNLIDALLQLSRVTRAEMQAESTDLSPLAEKILDNLYQHEPNRLLEIHIQPDLQAWGDARLLQLVLDNLLRNAWKFSSRAVRARIEFGCIEQEGERVYFVRDNGVGFDMQYADKLFGAFQRLHGMTEFEGTGIGLATVSRIIHRHGGRVWAEGTVGQGAAFYFTLGTGESGNTLPDTGTR